MGCKLCLLFSCDSSSICDPCHSILLQTNPKTADPKINIKKGIMMSVDWYLNNKSFYKSFSKKDMTKRFGKL